MCNFAAGFAKKAYPNLTIQKNITHKIMGNIIKPIVYTAALDMKQTEHGIKQIKEFFQQNLSTELRLRRVTAPLSVRKHPLIFCLILILRQGSSCRFHRR